MKSKLTVITSVLLFINIVLIVTYVCLYLNNRCKEVQYPATMVVTNIDTVLDIVYMEDGNKNIWTMYGVEDWQIGDTVSLIMSDNKTPDNIFDDEIKDIRYSNLCLR